MAAEQLGLAIELSKVLRQLREVQIAALDGRAYRLLELGAEAHTATGIASAEVASFVKDPVHHELTQV